MTNHAQEILNVIH